MKATQKHEEMLDRVCKGFKFTGSNDTGTIITRDEAAKAGKLLKELKKDILEIYPYDYTLKIKSIDEFDAKSSLTVLRQLMRFHGRRLVSHRLYKYCKIKKGPVNVYHYNLI